jgi:hypothetical protein
MVCFPHTSPFVVTYLSYATVCSICSWSNTEIKNKSRYHSSRLYRLQRIVVGSVTSNELKRRNIWDGNYAEYYPTSATPALIRGGLWLYPLWLTCRMLLFLPTLYAIHDTWTYFINWYFLHQPTYKCISYTVSGGRMIVNDELKWFWRTLLQSIEGPIPEFLRRG